MVSHKRGCFQDDPKGQGEQRGMWHLARLFVVSSDVIYETSVHKQPHSISEVKLPLAKNVE